MSTYKSQARASPVKKTSNMEKRSLFGNNPAPSGGLDKKNYQLAGAVKDDIMGNTSDEDLNVRDEAYDGLSITGMGNKFGRGDTLNNSKVPKLSKTNVQRPSDLTRQNQNEADRRSLLKNNPSSSNKFSGGNDGREQLSGYQFGQNLNNDRTYNTNIRDNRDYDNRNERDMRNSRDNGFLGGKQQDNRYDDRNDRNRDMFDDRNMDRRSSKQPQHDRYQGRRDSRDSNRSRRNSRQYENRIDKYVRKTIQQIADVFKKDNHDLKNVQFEIPTKNYNGIGVASYHDVMNYFGSQWFRIPDRDLEDLIATFIVEDDFDKRHGRKKQSKKDRQMIDIGALLEEVSKEIHGDFDSTMGRKSKQALNDFNRGHKKAMKLQKALKHYSLVKSFNLTTLFRHLDQDHSQGLDVREFAKLLQNLRQLGYDVDENDTKDIFRVIDANGDQKISIDELTSFINNNALKDQINDPDHWAFRIFEEIRKHLLIKQCSIAELFNMSLRDISPDNHNSTGNYVRWHDFIGTLQNSLKIQMFPKDIPALKEMLDDSLQPDSVNLLEFSDLLGLDNSSGMEQRHSKYNDTLVKAQKECPQLQRNFFQAYDALKRLSRMLILKKVSSQGLRLEFQGGLNNPQQANQWQNQSQNRWGHQQYDTSSHITEQQFIKALETVLSLGVYQNYGSNQKPDSRLIADVARYLVNSYSKIDYDLFIEIFEMLAGSYRTYSLVMQGFFASMSQMGMSQLRDLFNRINLPNVGQIRKSEFSKNVAQLNIYVNNQELEQFIVYISSDSQGNGFQFHEMEKEFNSYIQENNLQLNNQRPGGFGQQPDRYDPYAQQQPNNQFPGGFSAPSRAMEDAKNRFKTELTDIAQGLKDRNITAMDFFAQHRSGNDQNRFGNSSFQQRNTGPISAWDFEAGVKALQLRTQQWRCDARDLFEKLCEPNQATIDLQSLDGFFQSLLSSNFDQDPQADYLFEKIVMCYRADMQYIQSSTNLGRDIRVNDAAKQIENDIMRDLKQEVRQVSTREIEQCLLQFCPLQGRRDMISGNAFIQNFQKISYERNIRQDRFVPPRGGKGGLNSLSMTDEERLVDGVLMQLKTVVDHRNIKLEPELQRLEKKERKINDYDRDATLINKVKVDSLMTFLNKLGYQFRSNDEGKAFVNHYGGYKGEFADYGALIADLSRPQGTPLAPVHEEKIETDGKVEVNENLVKAILKKIDENYRKDLKQELTRLEGQIKGRSVESNGYIESQYLFDFLDKDDRLMLSDKEKQQLTAKYQGTDFKKRGQINYRKMIEDISQMHGGGKRSPELVKELQEVYRLVKNALGGIFQLRSNLERVEDEYLSRDNKRDHYSAKTRELPEDQFYKALKRLDIKPITDKQKEMFNKQYMMQDQRGDLKINYMAFCEDLDKCMEMNVEKVPEANALTSTQKSAYDLIKRILEKDKLTNNFVARLRKEDKNNINMIKTDVLRRALEKIGAAKNSKEWEIIRKPLKVSKTDELDYRQFLKYLFDQKTVDTLLSTPISVLDVKPGEIESKAEFVLPKHTRGADSSGLNELGKKFIKRGGNYEEWLMSELPPGTKDRQNPSIDKQHFIKCLQEAMIWTGEFSPDRNDENNALTEFFDKYANSKGELKLSKLLQGLGLPPQQIGSSVFAAKPGKKPIRILSDEELERCMEMLKKIKSKCKKEGLDFDQKIIKRLRKEQEADHIPGLSFLEIIQERLGRPFAKDIELQTYIEDMVLYLAEESPSLISLKKLSLALKSNVNTPLKQDLIEKELAYKNDVKSALKNKEREKTAKRLAKFMKDKSFPFKDLLSQFNKESTEISRAAFKERLNLLKFPYKEEELQDLYRHLGTGNSKNVDVKPIEKYMKNMKAGSTNAEQAALSRLDGPANQRVKNTLEMIQRNLNKKGMDAGEFFKYLDSNNDGVVDRFEFVNGIDKMGLQGEIDKRDLKDLFDFMDANGDEELSRDEFACYIKGAEKSNEEKIRSLPDDLKNQMKANIQELFASMDDDNNGKLDVHELYHAYQSMGIQRNHQEVKDQIYDVTKGRDFLMPEEFQKLMEPVLLEQYLSDIENEENLRRIFRKADTEYKGYLDVVQLADAIKEMGAEISPDEVANLMSEADHDRNMQLDIDEFVNFFTMGGDMQFKDTQNARKFSEIQMARRLTPADFLKAFKGMPTNFIQSFIGNELNKNRCLPSSAFKAQVDPKTMLWKDLYDVRTRDLEGMNLSKDQQPEIRPIKTKVGACIYLQEATGVVTSSGGKEIQSNIKMRSIRASLMHKPHKRNQLLGNIVQAPAYFDNSNNDIWYFKDSRNEGQHMTDFMFRCIEMEHEELKKQSASIVFELMIGVQRGGEQQLTEMCCGWAELPLSQLDRSQTIRLDIKGGSPMAQTEIKKEDVQAKRSGYRYLTSFVTGTQSGLSIKIEPYSRLSEDQKFHLNLMPGTCLLHSELLHFISAFMNYKGKQFLSQDTGAIAFKKPPGDVIISTFPKLLDSPDICNFMTKIWKEDVSSKLNSGNNRNIKYLMSEMKDFVSRLYPVLYSVDIRDQIESKGITSSVAYDAEKLKQQKSLVSAALRFNKQNVAVKEYSAPSEMTDFTPFNIREFEFDVWDTTKQRRDQFAEKHLG